MKQHLFNLLTSAAVLAAAPALQAAPFNPKDASATPALLVHLDCDALRNSAVAKSILSDEDVQRKLAAVGALFDFDFRTQLHGLTVYTTDAHPKDGVLIVYADFNPDRLLALAGANESFQASTNGSRVTYSWIDDKKKEKGDENPRMYGAIVGHRVILGQTEARLIEALDVIDGKATSFVDKKGLPAAEGSESIILEGVLLKFDFDDADDKAAIFKMSKSVQLKLSEMGDKMAAHVRFEAADDDTATQIDSIATGLVAVLRLQKADPNATKLANAISIKQDGAVVGLTLSVPSSELIDIIKDDQKKKEEKKEHKAAEAKADTDKK